MMENAQSFPRVECHFLVVEDDVAMVRSFGRLLRSEQRRTGIHLGELDVAQTVREGIETLAKRSDWRGFVIDVGLPDGNGLDVLARAREKGSHAPAVVLTALNDPATITRAFELRSRYLVKTADTQSILSFFNDAVSADATTLYGTSDIVRDWVTRYHLTAAEADILVAAVEGEARDAVACARGITPRTLNAHVHNLLHKTGDKSLLAAVARLLRERKTGGL